MDTGNHPDPFTDAMGHGLHRAMQVGAPDEPTCPFETRGPRDLRSTGDNLASASCTSPGLALFAASAT